MEWTKSFYGIQHLIGSKNQYTLQASINNEFYDCFVRIVGSGSFCYKKTIKYSLEEAKEWLLKHYKILEEE